MLPFSSFPFLEINSSPGASTPARLPPRCVQTRGTDRHNYHNRTRRDSGWSVLKVYLANNIDTDTVLRHYAYNLRQRNKNVFLIPVTSCVLQELKAW